MPSLKIDKYFDITCCVCGFSRSTDYEMGFETNPARLRRVAKAEGWRAVSDDQNDEGVEGTLCPSCATKCKYINCSPPCGEKCDCEFLTADGYCRPAFRKAVERNHCSLQCFRMYNLTPKL